MRLQVGGSIASEHSIYLERQADRDLQIKLDAREYCYVFNARQTGKSSLLHRSMQFNRQQGHKCCFIDLSRIGTRNISSEQWYASIIYELWRGFRISSQFIDWWNAHLHLTPQIRFSLFWEFLLTEVYASDIITVYFDEVDSILSLPFPADDFFMVLRNCFNERAVNPEYQRLAVSLFGVVVRNELISERLKSPFTTSSEVNLEGFDFPDALPIASLINIGSKDSKSLLREVLYWTNGQPFLTQKLCALLNHNTSLAEGRDEKSLVKHIVNKFILQDWEYQDNPEHLKTIRDRLLRDKGHVADNLSSYLAVLTRAHDTGGEIDQEKYRRLFLSGIITLNNKELAVGCRIYNHIFNKDWVTRHLDAIRPYAAQLRKWQFDSNEEWLLKDKELATAQDWAKGKLLTQQDYDFIAASLALEKKHMLARNKGLTEEIKRREQAESNYRAALDTLESSKLTLSEEILQKSAILHRVQSTSIPASIHLNAISQLDLATASQYKSHMRLEQRMRLAGFIESSLRLLTDTNDSNIQEIKNEYFCFESLIDEVTEEFSDNLASRQINIQVDFKSFLIPLILSDRRKLKQILYVLVAVANELSIDSKVTISIEAKQTSEKIILDCRVSFAPDKQLDKVSRTAIELLDFSWLKKRLGIQFSIRALQYMNSQLYFRNDVKSETCFEFKLTCPCIKNNIHQSFKNSQFDIAYISQNRQLMKYCSALGFECLNNKWDDSFSGLSQYQCLIFDANPGELCRKLSFKHELSSLKLIPVIKLGRSTPFELDTSNITGRLYHSSSIHRLIKILEKPTFQIKKILQQTQKTKEVGNIRLLTSDFYLKSLVTEIGERFRLHVETFSTIAESLGGNIKAGTKLIIDFSQFEWNSSSEKKQLEALQKHQDELSIYCPIFIINRFQESLLSDFNARYPCRHILAPFDTKSIQGILEVLLSDT